MTHKRLYGVEILNMIIWIVQQNDWEGSYFIGAFSSEEKARNFVKRAKRRPRYKYSDLAISEVEVDEES